MFLAGFKFSLSKWVDFLIGFLSILGILFLDIENNIYAEYGFIILLSLFVALVLMGEVWRKIFSIRFLTVIGGMCYSIYLWHWIIFQLTRPAMDLAGASWALYVFRVLVVFALADIITGSMGRGLVINDFIYNSFLYLTLGCFGIASVDKFINKGKNDSEEQQ